MRSSHTRCRSCAASGHEVGRDAVRLRRRRPRPDAIGRRRGRRPGPDRVPGRGPRRRAAARRRGRQLLRTTGREVVAERRALDRLSPVAQLASARERVGLSLDRATRAIAGDLAARRRRVEQLGVRLAPTLPGRAGARPRAARPQRRARRPRRPARGDRPLVARTAAAALAVLGPQATLDRGYAIVRRADDGRIVRDPADAAPGTRLALRVAKGELPATADER